MVVMEILQSLRGMHVVWFIKDEVIDPVKKNGTRATTCNVRTWSVNSF